MPITQREALAIADKLKADVIGSSHKKVYVRYEGCIVARYGVTHSCLVPGVSERGE